MKTSTGEVFCETLPKLATVADKIAVIRSMTHGEAAHERGTHNMFTGYRPSPALQYPSMGSVVSHEYGPRNNLPPYVCIPRVPNEYAATGYLSSSFAPFSLGSDPADPSFRVQDLTLPNGQTLFLGSTGTGAPDEAPPKRKGLRFGEAGRRATSAERSEGLQPRGRSASCRSASCRGPS